MKRFNGKGDWPPLSKSVMEMNSNGEKVSVTLAEVCAVILGAMFLSAFCL